MVWVGISLQGQTPLVVAFQGGKINAHVNRNLISSLLVKGLTCSMLNGRDFIFQQDGVPAHAADLAQQWCEVHPPGFLAKDKKASLLIQSEPHWLSRFRNLGGQSQRQTAA